MPETGMIQGGWEFVWGAYGLTFATLVVYALTLSLRLRRARAAQPPEVSA
jgi:heme exporter protein D